MRFKGTYTYPERTKTVLVLSDLPYSREQKHVLLFRKSEILHYKVAVTNIPHSFFRIKTFLFVEIESWNPVGI